MKKEITIKNDPEVAAYREENRQLINQIEHLEKLHFWAAWILKDQFPKDMIEKCVELKKKHEDAGTW